MSNRAYNSVLGVCYRIGEPSLLPQSTRRASRAMERLFFCAELRAYVFSIYDFDGPCVLPPLIDRYTHGWLVGRLGRTLQCA